MSSRGIVGDNIVSRGTAQPDPITVRIGNKSSSFSRLNYTFKKQKFAKNTCSNSAVSLKTHCLRRRVQRKFLERDYIIQWLRQVALPTRVVV